MQQAADFLEESQDLYRVIGPLDGAALAQSTQFKHWTVEQVVRHLHFWNRMALLALTDELAFGVAIKPVMEGMQRGLSLPEIEAGEIAETGEDLVALWAECFEQVAKAYSAADPSQRCAWAGPSMSARSCITARQMETWAHGQEVYDLLGLDRINTDRIRNIVVLGVNTYDWTYKVRGQAAPEPKPCVSLLAPSGERWVYGDPESDSCIAGSAVGFAQVVTQTRHVDDTDLNCSDDVALSWMHNAQCFFGGPSQPPAPGSRCKQSR